MSLSGHYNAPLDFNPNVLSAHNALLRAIAQILSTIFNDFVRACNPENSLDLANSSSESAAEDGTLGMVKPRCRKRVFKGCSLCGATASDGWRKGDKQERLYNSCCMFYGVLDKPVQKMRGLPTLAEVAAKGE